MKTIVISSQKGGSAKSTLAALLSVEAERAGDGPAWLIDTDRQGTLTRWHDRRESDTPRRGEIPFKELAAGIAVIGLI
jgi:chromosome partitioning protein